MFAKLLFSNQKKNFTDKFSSQNPQSMDQILKGASMAIAFAHVSIHSRSKGHSAIAASSYRNGTKLYDARTGITHDYSHRKEIVFSVVMLPKDAISEFANREFLWNQVELAENRRDAQLCKDVVLALPRELSLEQQIELTKRFAQTHFVDNGLPADIAIHDHGDGNPHAHILIPTRRLERDRFSKYKARDLNPTFANKFIVEKDYWGEQWREYQNAFFSEQGLDLSVDLNHVISERHSGRIKNNATSYLHEELQLINTARKAIVLNPEEFIKKISATHSVFTSRDIEKVVYKTVKDTDHAADHLKIISNILQHQEIIHLGVNDHGIDSYTTRQQYIDEGELLSHVEQLHARKNHILNQSLDNIIAQYNLNEEQAEAIRFISNGSDISVLIGRPGVGKSYMLKPLKECFDANGYIVLGASISGKVAKALQTETGISTSTIASLNYRLKNEKLSLTRNHVLIIDEAGMVDFSNLAYLIKTVDKAGAKIVLVGDPNQLKPIHKGEIFRGIAAHTGYIELGNIRRQRDEGDRAASLALAQGEIKNAIQHYANKGAIHFNDGYEETSSALVNEWQQDLTVESIKQHCMLAFTRNAVKTLNDKGRAAAIQKGLVKQEGFEYFSENGAQKLALSVGERILFRQNSKPLGVRNGDLATITEINAKKFTALLDSGEQITISQHYKSIDYGYALTVHKSQGLTIEKASVYIDSTYWDKHLAFVAMTRHKESLKIYVNNNIHPNLSSLTQTLSRSTTKDNVIDWPLDFGMRFGIAPDTLVSKAIYYIDNAASTIKDKWNYIVNYEAYLNTQEARKKLSEQQALRADARQVAILIDEAQDLTQQFKQVEKEARQKSVKPYQLPQFDELYMRSLSRDKQAAELLGTKRTSIEKMTHTHNVVDKIKSYSERYERFKIIESIAKSMAENNFSSSLSKDVIKIDKSKDYPHIIHLAKRYKINSAMLYKKIDRLQQRHKQKREVDYSL